MTPVLAGKLTPGPPETSLKLFFLKQTLSCVLLPGVLLPDALLDGPSGDKDAKVMAEGQGFLTQSVSWVPLVQDQREKLHSFQQTRKGKRQPQLRLSHINMYNLHSQDPVQLGLLSHFTDGNTGAQRC